MNPIKRAKEAVARLFAKWHARRRYSKLVDMPSPLVAFFGLAGFIIAGWHGLVVSKILPDFLKTADSLPLNHWGWKGWLLLLVISLMGLWIWLFGSLAFRCNQILRDRWYQ